MTYQELAIDFQNTRTHASFAALYNKMKPSLRNFVRNIVKDPDVTEDVLSKTFIKVYEKIDSYKPEYAITTWVWVIAKRECIRYFRKDRNTKVSLTYLKSVGGDITEDSSGDARVSFDTVDKTDHEFKNEEYFENEDQNLMDKYRIAREAIENLKPLYKDILIDNLINHMKYKDIAYKHDKILRQMLKSLNRVLDSTSTARKKNDAQKTFDAYYKKSLQRIKNRIRRGKSLIAAEINQIFVPSDI